MFRPTSLRRWLLVATVWMTCPSFAQELAFEFNGCAHVLRDSTCLLGPERKITLWADAPVSDSLRIRLDNRIVTSLTVASIDGGVAVSLNVPEDRAILTIELGGQSGSMLFDAVAEPQLLTEATALYKQGNHAEVIALLPSAVIAELAAEWRGKAYKLVGEARQRRGESDQARLYLAKAIAADTSSGRHSDAIISGTVLAYLQLKEGESPTQIRQLLTSLPAPPKSDARSVYNLSYFQGLTDFNAGNARGALKQLEKAARQARRMQDFRRQSYAEMLLAVQLQQIGRREQAAELIAPWVHAPQGRLSECQQAAHGVNYVWAQLLVLEGGGDVTSPVDLAKQGDELSQRCENLDKNNVLSNLALSYLHAGDPQAAHNTLARVDRRSESLTLRTILWLEDIEGRVAIAQNDLSKAFQHYSTLSNIANAALSPSARWRAAAGLARVQFKLGDFSAALRAYEHAESIMNDDMLLVPLEAGRETLLTSRHLTVADHLDLLLKLGKTQEAFELARRSRNRVLQSLNVSFAISNMNPGLKSNWEEALASYRTLRQQLDDEIGNAWTLAADELEQLEARHKKYSERLNSLADQALSAAQLRLPPEYVQPAPGETLLSFFPLRKGWVSFAQTSDALDVSELACARPSPADIASCLIEPFTDIVQRSRTIRILPTGTLKNVDFHALPIGGKRLIDIAAVTYSADLGVRDEEENDRPSRSIREATLVVDSTGDLSGARAEVKQVDTLLRENGSWNPTSFAGDRATRVAVRDAIEDTDLFHYSGHARFEGAYGWSSELLLANDTTLKVSDIITLKRAPQLVVLSGCETATTSGESLPDSMGLANAFISAGSQYVIATSRVVDDNTATEIVGRFYQKWIKGTDPRSALRHAQLAVSQTTPQADWAAYRLIEQ